MRATTSYCYYALCVSRQSKRVKPGCAENGQLEALVAAFAFCIPTEAALGAHLKCEKFNARLLSWLSLESSDFHPRRSWPSNLSTPLVPCFSSTMQPNARIFSLTVIAALALAHPLPRDATPSGACTSQHILPGPLTMNFP